MASEEKIDPIREKYYGPIEVAERNADRLFWAVTALSLATVAVDLDSHRLLSQGIQAAFVIATLVLFVLSMVGRLHLMPKAEGRRRSDFLSSAIKVDLTHEQTSHYYTSDERDVSRRIVAQVLESAIYSRNTASRMRRAVIWSTTLYLILWLCLALWRDFNIAWAAVAAQALFSEHIVARCWRIIWLHSRIDELFNEAYQMLQSTGAAPIRMARAVALFSEYECAKATAAVLLSERFYKHSMRQSDEEWQKACDSLGIKDKG